MTPKVFSGAASRLDAPAQRQVQPQAQVQAQVQVQVQAQLQALRDELDAIDQQLLALVRERLECCCRIGHWKKQHGVPMMQPGRIGVVQDRAAAFAMAHGLSAEFLRRLYAHIIEETCRLEDAIIGAQGAADDDDGPAHG